MSRANLDSSSSWNIGGSKAQEKRDTYTVDKVVYCVGDKAANHFSGEHAPEEEEHGTADNKTVLTVIFCPTP